MESLCFLKSSASFSTMFVDVGSSISLGTGSEGRPWETVAVKSKRSESKRIFILICYVYLCHTKVGIYSGVRFVLRYGFI